MSTTTVTDPSTGQPVSKNRLLVTSGLGWMFDAMDVGLLSFILAALKLDWGLTAGQMGWLGAVNSIGMAVGAVMFGMMADASAASTCSSSRCCCSPSPAASVPSPPR